jgi:hypothetical protein
VLLLLLLLLLLSPGVTELYLKTMDALDAITPGVPIYFVEGAGQTGLRGVNWGNGFVTERGLIARNGLSGERPVVANRAIRQLSAGSDCGCACGKVQAPPCCTNPLYAAMTCAPSAATPGLPHPFPPPPATTQTPTPSSRRC